MAERGLLRLTNCTLLRDHRLVVEDLWVRNGVVVDPEVVFYVEKDLPLETVDCRGAVVAPGFIELQINGMYVVIDVFSWLSLTGFLFWFLIVDLCDYWCFWFCRIV